LTALAKVEYAVKAVENGGTAIGIRCKDGVVLALEKLVSSKLLKPGANKRVATVDRHIGVVGPSILLTSAQVVDPGIS
jgi:20S proteasome subunit alpha 7